MRESIPVERRRTPRVADFTANETCTASGEVAGGALPEGEAADRNWSISGIP
jgi:hypothetical protein